ncbi:hypothetical protein XENOCAPTIV_001360, partial [Xenoophorus captivus]
EKGHKDITVFVPAWRKEQSRPDALITGKESFCRQLLIFPIWKKCTYGHKCKYYHPERVNQPQRSVADELRAFAKLSAVKTMSEGALAKCGTGPAAVKGDISSEAKRVAPKRQSDPSIRSVACEPPEALSVARKSETNSVPSLVSALSVPTMQPAKSHAAGALNTRSASSPIPGSLQFAHNSLEHMSSIQYPPILVTNSHGASVTYSDQFPKYDSVSDHGYYSLHSDFSNMSMSSMHNVDSFCSMEHEHVYQRNPSHCPESCLSHSNSDSFSSYGDLYPSSVDSSLEESIKGQQQAPAQARMQAFSHGFRHEALTRVQSYGQEEPKQGPRKQSGAHLAPHIQHAVVGARSSCPGDYPLTQNILPPLSSQPTRSLGMTRMDSISDSRLYDSNPNRQRRPPLCREQHASWDPLPCGTESYGYHSYPLSNSLMPCCERVMVRSMPDKMEQIWNSPWENPSAAEHQERYVIPDHQYQTYRNLCNIFPAYIVHSVMEKNPHLTDPQQLAAVIVTKLRSCH